MYEGPDAQGNEDIFVLGNGPSRKNIGLSKLDGTVIGCNAIYRDFTPDVICATDAGIMSDIIDSGYDGKCYFTHNSWNLLPTESYEALKTGKERETYRRFDAKYFVYISGLDSDVKKTQNYIIWVPKKMEHKIKNLNSSYGWSTGTSAVYVACTQFHPKKVYILGFDHKNDEYDNLYADTKHYYSRDNKQEWRTIHSKWSNQLFEVFNWFPNIEFYWVNYGGYVFSDGAFQENLHFLDEKEIWQH